MAMFISLEEEAVVLTIFFFRFSSNESTWEERGGTKVIIWDSLKSDVLPMSMAKVVLRSVRPAMLYFNAWVGP